MFLIQSEIGPLKKVLVHRPYHSLCRLTPSNCNGFLFDDAIWPEKAQQEHGVFTDLLKQQGVEVFFVEDLLTQAIESYEAKQYLLQECLRRVYHGSHVEELLMQYLNHLSNDELVSQLFSGITFQDARPYRLGLVSDASLPQDFILPPLPNQLFTRDSSVWIQNGLCLSSMTFSVRKPESAIVSTIDRYHPLFQQQKYPLWYEGNDLTQSLPNIEGGDILVINNTCLLIGLGQRTQPQAVEILAKHLFQHNQINEIIAIEIPSKRASMHLDTLLTMIDSDIFCSYYHDLNFRCWSVRPGEHYNDLVIEKQDSLLSSLCRVLNLKKIRVIVPTGDIFALEREQWNDAVNLLSIRPGLVFAYEQNSLTNRQLINAGITVIPLPGTELSRGRGGARCMTCPLQRGIV